MLQEVRVHLDPLHAMLRITAGIPNKHSVKGVFQADPNDVEKNYF